MVGLRFLGVVRRMRSADILFPEVTQVTLLFI
jgi:hypothetical protein